MRKIFALSLSLFLFIVSAQAMHRVDMRKTYARHNQQRACKADHRAGPDSCPCSFKSRCTYLPQIGSLGALLLISMMASGMLVDQVQAREVGGRYDPYRCVNYPRCCKNALQSCGFDVVSLGRHRPAFLNREYNIETCDYCKRYGGSSCERCYGRDSEKFLDKYADLCTYCLRKAVFGSLKGRNDL